jgi:hypothetical protein
VLATEKNIWACVATSQQMLLPSSLQSTHSISSRPRPRPVSIAAGVKRHSLAMALRVDGDSESMRLGSRPLQKMPRQYRIDNQRFFHRSDRVMPLQPELRQ